MQIDCCCRYGYGSAEFYSQILNGYGNASIPLETFVSDSQYMNHDEDFTLGEKFPLSEMKVSNSVHGQVRVCIAKSRSHCQNYHTLVEVLISTLVLGHRIS